MSARTFQIVLVAGAMFLFVLLYFAPKTIQATVNRTSASGKAIFENANISLYVNAAQKTLHPEQKKRIGAFIKMQRHDSLTATWDRLKRPDIASYYAEQAAHTLNTAKSWESAGTRYYYAIRFTQDNSEIPVLYLCAMRCFNKALRFDSKNTDARIMLASCYVEGTESPMEGINLLREVEKTDSNNVKLQLAFAFFSVKSGQLDKAITRFKKVLQVDSNYVEAYLHLADAYEQRGQTAKTIEMLQNYSGRITDITAKIEIDKYITQLKTNTNK